MGSTDASLKGERLGRGKRGSGDGKRPSPRFLESEPRGPSKSSPGGGPSSSGGLRNRASGSRSASVSARWVIWAGGALLCFAALVVRARLQVNVIAAINKEQMAIAAHAIFGKASVRFGRRSWKTGA